MTENVSVNSDNYVISASERTGLLSATSVRRVEQVVYCF